MLGRKTRWTLMAIAVGVLAFVAVGGPATAKHFIDGASIKPGTVGSTQLASGAVTSSKLSKSLKKGITGKTGPRGATGAAGGTGAAGAPGARGPAGAFNVVDTQSRVLGQFAGWYSSSYPMVFTPDGAILIYDNNIATNYLATVGGTQLYYKQPACAGTAYSFFNSSYPLQIAIVLESPPVPGSKVYVELPGTPESFTYQSYKTSSGCTTTSSSTSNMLAVKEAGTVPNVQKPLSLVPAS
jgi:hypothetical protein